jgi:hypothetical protein
MHFGHKWLVHIGCASGFSSFAMRFLEVLSQNAAHIDDLPFLGNTHIALGILSSCVVH